MARLFVRLIMAHVICFTAPRMVIALAAHLDGNIFRRLLRVSMIDDSAFRITSNTRYSMFFYVSQIINLLLITLQHIMCK